MDYPDSKLPLPTLAERAEPLSFADYRLISPATYARRTRCIHDECEDWMSAAIPVEGFDAEQFGIWEPVECHGGSSFYDSDRVSRLRREFTYVVEMARAIYGAIDLILEHEHPNNASPLTRAFYFATEARYLATNLDEHFPGTPVHSHAMPPSAAAKGIRCSAERSANNGHVRDSLPGASQMRLFV